VSSDRNSDIDGLPPWDPDWLQTPEHLLPWRAQTQLSKILDETRYGEVAGVKFDLQHPDMPSVTEWFSPTGATPFGIAFPWDRAMHGGSEELAAIEVTGGRQGWPVTQVYQGDTVTVRSVGRMYRGGGVPPLTDLHDDYEIWVGLNVIRPDGCVYEAQQAIGFVGRDAMEPYLDATLPDDDAEGLRGFLEYHTVKLEKVGRRIERLRAQQNGREQSEWLSFAAKAYALAIEQAGSIIEAPDDGEPWVIEQLLDAATAAGYALGRSEALQIVPLARRGAVAQASQQAAAHAARRRADPIRRLASEIIKANPNISQGQCARQLAAATDRDQRSIARLISSLFEWRTLPGGGREKRPKAIQFEGG